MSLHCTVDVFDRKYAYRNAISYCYVEECKSRRCLANVHIGMCFVCIPVDGAESAVVYPLTFLVIKS